MKLGIGLIGCGRAAVEHHLPVIGALGSARLVALADRSEERLARVAERAAGVKTYVDHRQLLQDRRVDLVAICVPAAQRATLVADALEGGKHLYIEKPLALGAAEAEAIVDRCLRAKGRVTVGHNLRSHVLLEEAKRFLIQGRLGRVECMATLWSSDRARCAAGRDWRRRRSTGGGVLFEMGVHHFDLVRYFWGDSIESVSVVSRAGDRQETAVSLSARTAADRLLTMSLSEDTVPAHHIELIGDKGRLELDLYRRDGFLFSPAGRVSGDLSFRLLRRARELRRLSAVIASAIGGGVYQASFRRHWRAFLQSILEGTPVPCPASDAAAAVRAVLLAHDSFDTAPAPDGLARAARLGAAADPDGRASGCE